MSRTYTSASNSPRVPERWTGLSFDAVLSDSDLELARLLVHDRTNSAIAMAMNTTEDKVKADIRRLFYKTGASCRIHIVVWMYETGWVIPGMPYLPVNPQSIAQLPTAEQMARHQLTRVREHITATRTELDSIADVLDKAFHNHTDRSPSTTDRP